MAQRADIPAAERHWARHLPATLLGLIATGICAVAAVGFDMATTMAAQAEALKGVHGSIDSLRLELDRQGARFDGYLTRSEAEVRFRTTDQRAEDHARRIERLEHRRNASGG